MDLDLEVIMPIHQSKPFKAIEKPLWRAGNEVFCPLGARAGDETNPMSAGNLSSVAARSDRTPARPRHFSGGVGALLLCLILNPLTYAAGPELIIQLPDSTKPKSATLTATEMKLDTPGRIRGHSIAFTNLLPDVSYSAQITLADGTILNGIDLGWYNLEPPKEGTKPMTRDDREQVRAIIQDIPSFYNKSEILHLRGDHDRAVTLVQLVRDTDFYNGAGEVVWRIELWYFKNQYGGWEKVQQQNKVSRRERYKTHDEFKAATGNLKWVPELGGIKLKKDETTREITLTPSAMESGKSTGAGPGAAPADDEDEEEEDEDPGN
jgi:hypothetical protein